MTLDELALRFGTDKSSAGHGYCEHYEHHLGAFRHERGYLRLLEIGVQTGASLLMWEAFLPNAQIVGVDIDPPPFADRERVQIVQCDIKAYDPTVVFDVIVDDGSHMASDVTAAHHRLWPWLLPGGWYVIEDLAAQWMPFYHGGPNGSEAISWIEKVLRDVMLNRSEVSEAHLYGEILFLRKA